MPGNTDNKSSTGYVKGKESGVATLERIQSLDLKPLIEERRVEKWTIAEPQVRSFYQGFLDQMFGPGYKHAPEKLASATYTVKKGLGKAQSPDQFPSIIENGIEELKNPFEETTPVPSVPENDVVEEAEQVAADYSKKIVEGAETVQAVNEPAPTPKEIITKTDIENEEEIEPKKISEKEVEKKVDTFITAHSQELEESAVYENLSKTLENPNKNKIIEDELDGYSHDISPLDPQSVREEVKESSKIADLSEEELVKRIAPIIQNNQPLTLEQVTEIKDESFDSAVAILAEQTKDPNLSSAATDIGTGLGYKLPDESYLQSRSLRAATIPMMSFANIGGAETAEVAIGMAASEKAQERVFYYLLSRDKKFAAMVDASSDPNLKRLKNKALKSSRESHQHHLKYQQFLQQIPGGEARAQSVARRSVRSHIAGPVVVSNVIFTRIAADTMGSIASDYNVPVYYSVPSARESGGGIISSSMNFVSGGLSSVKRTARGIKTAKNLAKTAKTAATAAKTAGTIAKAGAMTAETTNPVGWAMLAAQVASPLKKLLKNIAKAGVAVGVYLMLMYGLKFLGLAAGFVFGAVTGLPLLLLGPPGWVAYGAWVAGWTAYGYFQPLNMLNLTMHPLVTATNLWNSVTGALTGDFGALGSSLGSITGASSTSGALIGATIGFSVGGPIGAIIGFAVGASVGYLVGVSIVKVKGLISAAASSSISAAGGIFGSIGSGITGFASSLWGGTISMGGSFLGGAASIGSTIWGAISGGSISTSLVAVPLATTFGTITIGGVLVGITTGAAFFDPPYVDTLINPEITENDYFTLEKTAHERQIRDIENPPQNISFTIRLEAKEDITIESIEDKFSAGGENITIELERRCRALPGEVDLENPNVRIMAAGDSWQCVFEETVETDWDDSIVRNTVTVTVQAGDPVEETSGSASAIVRIGNPPSACDFIEIPDIANWSDIELANVSLVCDELNKAPSIITLIESTPGVIMRKSSSNPGWCGQVNGENEITFFCNMESVNLARYVMIHEIGHVIGNYNSGVYNEFRTVYAREGLLPTYVYGDGTADESFAELIADYVVSKYHIYLTRGWSGYPGGPWNNPSPQWTTLKQDRPIHYNFAKDRLFGGYEY